MASIPLLFLLGVVLVSTTLGCGSGHHGGDRNLARERAIASTRLARVTFAVAGMAKRVARGPSFGMGHRAKLVFKSLKRTRDVEQGLDEDLGLYYTLTGNADGSGRQDLFLGAANGPSAGSFEWPAPEWNGAPGSFPAEFHATFNITKGGFAGTSGTLDLTAQDSTGDNGHIHMVLTNSKGERSEADFDVVNGKLKGKQHVRLGDGTECNVTNDFPDAGGVIIIFDFPDGSNQDIEISPDGSGSSSYWDSWGEPNVNASWNSDGVDTLNYSDGSTETVDVDTGSSSDTDSGDSDVWKKVKLPRPSRAIHPIRRH